MGGVDFKARPDFSLQIDAILSNIFGIIIFFRTWVFFYGIIFIAFSDSFIRPNELILRGHVLATFFRIKVPFVAKVL